MCKGEKRIFFGGKVYCFLFSFFFFSWGVSLKAATARGAFGYVSLFDLFFFSLSLFSSCV